MDKTSYSLNFKWLAVIKNNLICGALANWHATEWLPLLEREDSGPKFNLVSCLQLYKFAAPAEPP